MDITIVSLVYNHAPYLYELFAGICVQDPSITVQWHIINDASTDKSSEVLHQLVPTVPSNVKVNLIEHPENMGAMFTCEEAVSLPVDSRYFMLLEGDDYLKPGFLSKTVRFLDENPDFGAVHTGIDIYVEHTMMFWSNYLRQVAPLTAQRTGGKYIVPTGDVFEDLLMQNFIQTCGFVARTNIYKQYATPAIWDQIPYEYTGTDYPTFLEIAKHHKIGYIPDALTVYRVQHNGLTHSGDYRKRRRNYASFTTIEFDIMQKYPSVV